MMRKLNLVGRRGEITKETRDFGGGACQISFRRLHLYRIVLEMALEGLWVDRRNIDVLDRGNRKERTEVELYKICIKEYLIAAKFINRHVVNILEYTYRLK